MIYPEFPSRGDVIGICAPSSGVGEKTDSFDLSLDVLHEAGFLTYETDSVRNEGCPSESPSVRGAEFNSLFEDDDIKSVFCASGGDYAVEMLPYIDEDLLRSKPKWFAGYSDPTCIEMLLTTKLDIASIYGVNAGSFYGEPLHEYQLNALSVLGGELPVQHSYDMWASYGFDEEEGCYIFDEPAEWTLLVPEEGELTESDCLDVTGRLIGGCIDVLDWVIGTPFQDLKGFTEKYSGDGFIWFFDNYEMTPMQQFYTLNKMKVTGLFEKAKVVIFGRVCFPGEATDIDYLEQIERIFSDTDIPVIWGADVGHTKPSMTFINGSIGHLTFKDGDACLKMKLE